MDLRPYRDVLADRRVRQVLVLGILTRVPATSGIVLTLYVVQTLGRGYAAAGLVATAFTLGSAIGAPWRGRVVDRRGLRRALLPSIIGETACLAATANSPYALLLPLSFIGGIYALPAFTVIRQSLTVLVPDGRRRTVLALDSMGVELSFIIGPALVVWIATATDPATALRCCAALVFTAGLALWLVNPAVRSPQPIPVPPAVTGPDADGANPVDATDPEVVATRWLSAPLLAVLGATLGATIVLYGTDVGIIAVLRSVDAVAATGLVFATWAAGSITGALIYGQLRSPPQPLWLLLGLAVMTTPMALAGSVLTAAVLVFIAGAMCAPVITATAEQVTRLVPEANRGAALGWHGSALTLGGAVGGPLAGSAIDIAGPGAGFLAVAAAGALLAVAGLSIQRLRVHHLAGRHPPVRPVGLGDSSG